MGFGRGKVCFMADRGFGRGKVCFMADRGFGRVKMGDDGFASVKNGFA